MSTSKPTLSDRVEELRAENEQLRKQLAEEQARRIQAETQLQLINHMLERALKR
jgi:hypothetical protein